jgi:hypothetical protein
MVKDKKKITNKPFAVFAGQKSPEFITNTRYLLTSLSKISLEVISCQKNFKINGI